MKTPIQYIQAILKAMGLVEKASREGNAALVTREVFEAVSQANIAASCLDLEGGSRPNQFQAMTDDRLAEIHLQLNLQDLFGVKSPLANELEAEVVRQRHLLKLALPYLCERVDRVFFGMRGTGNDDCYGCFVCGKVDHVQRNISGFMKSRGEAELAATWFAPLPVRVDSRYGEDQRIQLKIGACADHRHCLSALSKLIMEDDRHLAAHMVEAAREAEEAVDG